MDLLTADFESRNRLASPTKRTRSLLGYLFGKNRSKSSEPYED